MLKVGLTGGVGSGKSTVAKKFAQLNVPILDADEIAHTFLQPHTTIYDKIIAHFGKQYLTAQNAINRNKLRQKIFSDQKQREWLEDLLHPIIREQIIKQLAKLHSPYCILVIPLLLETRYNIEVDRVLIVDCPIKIQLQRIILRDRINIDLAKAIINSQIKRQDRLQQADDVIYNQGSIERLQVEVQKLHDYYLKIAKNYVTL